MSNTIHSLRSILRGFQSLQAPNAKPSGGFLMNLMFHGYIWKLPFHFLVYTAGNPAFINKRGEAKRALRATLDEKIDILFELPITEADIPKLRKIYKELDRFIQQKQQ